MSRPARSDAHLSPEGEVAMEAEVREYYDDAAPKRHTKPSRSEPSKVYTDAVVPDDSHPELDRFQELEAHTEKLVCEGGKVEDEFVETEYYKDLGCVGKQHHTTGTGFIKMDKPTSFHLSEDPEANERHASCKGNPATNEWIPSADTAVDVQILVGLFIGLSCSMLYTCLFFCNYQQNFVQATSCWFQVYPESDKPNRSDS